MNLDKIYLAQIPDEGLILNLKVPSSDFKDLDSEVSESLGETSFKGSVKKVGSRYIVSGRLTSDVTLQCDRCLCVYELKISEDFAVYFALDKPGEPGKRTRANETDSELEDIIHDSINLNETLFEQLILQIPMKALCSADCRGLCSECGAELNKGECGCDRTSIDPRLMKLKDLLISEE